MPVTHSSRDHVIVPNTTNNMFNLDIESTAKRCSIVNNVGKALMKKTMPMLGSKKGSLLEQKRVRKETITRYKISKWFEDMGNINIGNNTSEIII